MHILRKKMSTMPFLLYANLKTQRNMSSLRNRLNSFAKLNLESRFAKLAAAGYCYDARKKRVYCHYCFFNEDNFLTHIDPFILHAKRNPHCKFLRKTKGDIWIDNACRNKKSAYEEDLFICRVCAMRSIRCIFNPCGHALACDICVNTLSHCLFCKVKVSSFRKIYY